jgi:hypothetical protein
MKLPSLKSKEHFHQIRFNCFLKHLIKFCEETIRYRSLIFSIKKRGNWPNYSGSPGQRARRARDQTQDSPTNHQSRRRSYPIIEASASAVGRVRTMAGARTRRCRSLSLHDHPCAFPHHLDRAPLQIRTSTNHKLIFQHPYLYVGRYVILNLPLKLTQFTILCHR